MDNIKTKQDLCNALECKMRETGYSNKSIRNAKYIWRHLLAGDNHSLRERIQENLQKLVRRTKEGLMTQPRYVRMETQAARLIGLLDGDFFWRQQQKTSMEMGSEFLPIMHELMETNVWTRPVHRQVVYMARVFFRWLTANNVSNIRELTHDLLRQYLCERSQESIGFGMNCVKKSLKWMFGYLFSRHLITIDFSPFLSAPFLGHKRLLPAFSTTEIDMIVQCAYNSTSPTAKRDLAIVLIGRHLGVRANDIANLKLSDIDWANGAMSFSQGKTGVRITLPLIQEVGLAIKDYVLNERPKCSSDLLFVARKIPGNEYHQVRVVGMFSKLSKRAGILRSRYDGKSFHAFRRTLGRDLVMAEVPMTMVRQILGHSSDGAIDAYINLDSVHLKNCALGFRGIELSERSIFHV